MRFVLDAEIPICICELNLEDCSLFHIFSFFFFFLLVSSCRLFLDKLALSSAENQSDSIGN